MKRYKFSMVGSATGSSYSKEDIFAVVKMMKSYNSSLDYHNSTIREDFEKLFSEYIGVNYAVSVNSGNCAMDLILKFLNLSSEDEVISCAINFHGTHLSIIGTGAKLIMCDVDEKKLNIDIIDLEKKITKKTKAIIATHMNGLSNDMDSINKIINKYNKKFGIDIKLIADSARSCGALYKNRKTGNDCWAATFSFQAQKQISTLGEGGMIVTNDSALFKKVKHYSCFGGLEEWGTCYRLSKTQAALGIVQLSKLDQKNELRRTLALNRNKLIKDAAPEVVLPFDNNDYYNVFTYYTVILPKYWKGESKKELVDYLANCNIVCPPRANTATYKLNPYILKNINNKQINHVNSVHERLLTLPIHYLMSEEENLYIIKNFLLKYLEMNNRLKGRDK